MFHHGGATEGTRQRNPARGMRGARGGGCLDLLLADADEPTFGGANFCSFWGGGGATHRGARDALEEGGGGGTGQVRVDPRDATVGG
jgi:hypothetical protein